MTDLTTIKIKKSTRNRLAQHGRKNETYDDIINQLLDRVTILSSKSTPTDDSDLEARIEAKRKRIHEGRKKPTPTDPLDDLSKPGGREES